MGNCYAVLHDKDPGPYHYENVLSAKHESVYLRAELTPEAIIVRATPLRFEAVRPLPFGPRPVWVTLWDGPNYLLTVQVGVDAHINKGDSVDISLDWTMLHSEAKPR
jgi:hypothetical protein